MYLTADCDDIHIWLIADQSSNFSSETIDVWQTFDTMDEWAHIWYNELCDKRIWYNECVW